MKTLNAWIKAHPYKALIFVFLITLIAACMAVVNEQGFWCGAIFGTAVVGCWVATFLADTKLPIILAFAIATTSLQAAEPPRDSVGGVAVGVVVICVGGYCVYKVVKFCQRKFPKETAGTNSTSAFIPQADGESAASWNYGSMGSCDPTLTPEPSLLSAEPSGTLFTVDVRIDEEGNAAVGMSADQTATQSWTEFQAEVARHGVYVTGNADGAQYFSTNRVPCNAADVAISFDAITKTIDLKDSGGPVKLIEVDRSVDLRNWTPFLRTTVGAGGRGLRIQDATTIASMFYRVNISNL